MAIGGSGGGGASAIRAGRAFVELFAEDSKLQRALGSWKSRLQSFAGVAVKIGASMLAGGAALLAPLTAAVGTIQDLAKQDTIARAFGLTTEAFTGIAGVAKSAGEDTREFIESLVTLGKVASEGAVGKGGVAADFFSELNLNAKEFAALKPDEQFFKFFSAVRQVEDPLRRVRLLMVAFGEDGGKYLLPLLDKSDVELRGMAKGFAVTSEEAKAATQASRAYAGIVTVLDQTWQAFAAAVAPALAEVFSLAKDLLSPLRDWIKQNAALVAGIVAVTAALTIGGAAFLAIGGMLSLAATAVGGFAASLAAIKVAVLAVVSPVGIVVAAVAALAAGLAYLWSTTEDGRGAIAQVKAGLSELAGTFSTALQGIKDAFAVGDLALAGKIAFTALRLEFAKMLGWWQDRWNAFKGFFVDGWYDAVKLLSLGMSDATKFMEDLFVNLGQVIQRNLGESLTASLRKYIVAFMAILELTNALGQNDGPIAVAKRIYEDLSRTPEDAKAKTDESEKRRRDRNKDIEDEARREQEARNKARQGDKDELNGLIGRLQKELEDAVGEAGNRAFRKQLEGVIGGGVEGGLTRRIGALNVMAAFGNGGFGGPLRAQFGIGDKIEQKQLEHLDNIDKGVEKLPEKIADQVDRKWRVQ